MSFTLHSITMPFRTTNRSLCFLNTAWTSIANTTTYTRCPRKSFSGSSISLSSKNKQQKIDPRVTLIRYHMQHPLMPRPLRLSRGRALRHWTIARAWSLWEKKKKMQANLELQRLLTSCTWHEFILSYYISGSFSFLNHRANYTFTNKLTALDSIKICN